MTLITPTPQLSPSELQPSINQPNSNLPIILALVIVAFVSGGSVYLWQQKTISQLRNNQLNEIQNLTSQIAPTALPSDMQAVTDPLSENITPTDKKDYAKNTYSNTDLGFSFDIPAGAKVDKVLNDEHNRQVSFTDSYGGFHIMLSPAYENFNLSKYYYMDMLPDHKTTLSGIEANVYVAPEGYCDGPGCSKPYVSYVTRKGNDIYHLSFTGRTKPNDDDLKIISSFKFIY